LKQANEWASTEHPTWAVNDISIIYIYQTLMKLVGQAKYPSIRL
jgi:hypothetical protein